MCVFTSVSELANTKCAKQKTGARWDQDREHDWNRSLHDGAPRGNRGEQNIIPWMFHLSFSHYHALTSAVSRLLWNEEMLLLLDAALTFTSQQLFSLLTLHLQHFHAELLFCVIVTGVHLEHHHKKPYCFQQSAIVCTDIPFLLLFIYSYIKMCSQKLCCWMDET